MYSICIVKNNSNIHKEIYMSNGATSVMRWTEMGLVPDTAIRAGIRRLLVKRLAEIEASDVSASADALNLFVHEMCEARVAPFRNSPMSSIMKCLRSSLPRYLASITSTVPVIGRTLQPGWTRLRKIRLPSPVNEQG